MPGWMLQGEGKWLNACALDVPLRVACECGYECFYEIECQVGL